MVINVRQLRNNCALDGLLKGAMDLAQGEYPGLMPGRNCSNEISVECLIADVSLEGHRT